MAILEPTTLYYSGDVHIKSWPTRSALADCQIRTPTIAEKAKVGNLQGQLHRATLRKDKHLIKALEQQILNITHTF